LIFCTIPDADGKRDFPIVGFRPWSVKFAAGAVMEMYRAN